MNTNEMEDGYANGDYQSMEPPVVTQLVPSPVTTDTSDHDDSVVIGAPSSDVDAKNVYIYSNSITAVSQDDSPIAAFDVVFSVQCTCPHSGNTKTYQVVKRIGVDKLKMAREAETSTPVSIVEAKQSNGGIPTSRFKQLAGLKD